MSTRREEGVSERIQGGGRLDEIYARLILCIDLHRERSHARLRFEMNDLKHLIYRLIQEGYILERRK